MNGRSPMETSSTPPAAGASRKSSSARSSRFSTRNSASSCNRSPGNTPPAALRLESLAFPVGYGVEIAHLIDLARDGKIQRIAQTDLVRRIHRNRGDDELGCMAFAILRVVLRRLERDRKLTLASPPPDLYQFWSVIGERAEFHSKLIPEPERPPMCQRKR